VTKRPPRQFKALGENIARRRKALGFSQAAFAHHTGVGISGLKDIERGVSEGHIDTREAIATALECEVADLYLAPGVRHAKALQPTDGTMGAAIDLLTHFQKMDPGVRLAVSVLIFGDEGYLNARRNPDQRQRALKKLHELREVFVP
jgi:transcriptional regulator with XRE-family HTH domain